MKRFLILTSVVAIILGLSSCGNIDESSAEEVAQVISAPVNMGMQNSTTSRAWSFSSSLSYTHTQEDGGTAVFSFTSGSLELSGYTYNATAVYTDYIVTYTNEDGIETEYLLDGEVGYTVTYSFLSTSLTYELVIDNTESDNTLHITGGGIDSDVALDITNSMTLEYTYSETGGSATGNYDVSGTVNGVEIDGKTGTFDVSYSSTP